MTIYGGRLQDVLSPPKWAQNFSESGPSNVVISGKPSIARDIMNKGTISGSPPYVRSTENLSGREPRKK